MKARQEGRPTPTSKIFLQKKIVQMLDRMVGTKNKALRLFNFRRETICDALAQSGWIKFLS